MASSDPATPRLRAAKAGVLALALLVVGAVVFRAASQREEPALPQPAAKPAPKPVVAATGVTRQAAPPPSESEEKVGRALQDAAIRNLIQNYRVAYAQGDAVTVRASMNALKRRPQEAREVLRSELARTRDESLAGFYKFTLEELGP